MDQKEKIKNCCLEKEVSPCVSACPFHFDARAFISRMRRGGFNFAYRLYADAVAFPEIVSMLCGKPCIAVCPLKGAGGAVDMGLLERACAAYASNREPNNYNIPPKGARAAIVGAGPSGLACLLKLANRKYDVTLFEKSGRIGGSLWDKLPSEVFLKDIELQLKNENYELRLNSEVSDINELSRQYDAVYIAAGAAAGDFGLSFQRGAGAPVPAGGNIYVGGSQAGSKSAVDSIADGIKAAGLIDAFIKTGTLKSAEPHSPTRIKINPSNIKNVPGVRPADGVMFTKEEAKNEAKRCVMCRCDFCARSCDLMEYYQKFPKLIEQEVHITIFPGTLDGNGTVSTRLISTCNQCGLCSSVCPEDIDVGLFLRESHIAMRNKGAMPWAFHEFWLRDMEHADSERSAFSYTPQGAASSRYLFFPGCQSGASNPEYVLKPYKFLLEKFPDTSIYLRCCGAPAMWGGEAALYERSRSEIEAEWNRLGRPTFIFSCPTCMEFFREYLPQVRAVSLVEMLAELGAPVADAGRGMSAALFDPCSSRNFPDAQKSARELLTGAGYELVPLEYEGKRAKCCSWGGQVDIANPPYAKWVIDKRKGESELPRIVYCTNCRDIFAGAGIKTRHILDIVFGLGGWDEAPATWSERHRRREYLKKMLEIELTGGAGSDAMKEELVMEPEVAAKLSRRKILEEDALDVIRFCETSGRKVADPATGHFIGYHEVGHMTFWVEYAPEGGGFRLFNAYGHRMKIELEDVWNGRVQKADL